MGEENFEQILFRKDGRDGRERQIKNCINYLTSQIYTNQYRVKDCNNTWSTWKTQEYPTKQHGQSRMQNIRDKQRINWKEKAKDKKRKNLVMLQAIKAWYKKIAYCFPSNFNISTHQELIFLNKSGRKFRNMTSI